MGLSSHSHLGAGWEVLGTLVRILTPHREPGCCHGCSAGAPLCACFSSTHPGEEGKPKLSSWAWLWAFCDLRRAPASAPGDLASHVLCLSFRAVAMPFPQVPAWAPPFLCTPLTPYSYSYVPSPPSTLAYFLPTAGIWCLPTLCLNLLSPLP